MPTTASTRHWPPLRQLRVAPVAQLLGSAAALQSAKAAHAAHARRRMAAMVPRAPERERTRARRQAGGRRPACRRAASWHRQAPHVSSPQPVSRAVPACLCAIDYAQCRSRQGGPRSARWLWPRALHSWRCWHARPLGHRSCSAACSALRPCARHRRVRYTCAPRQAVALRLMRSFARDRHCFCRACLHASRLPRASSRTRWSCYRLRSPASRAASRTRPGQNWRTSAAGCGCAQRRRRRSSRARRRASRPPNGARRRAAPRARERKWLHASARACGDSRCSVVARSYAVLSEGRLALALDPAGEPQVTIDLSGCEIFCAPGATPRGGLPAVRAAC